MGRNIINVTIAVLGAISGLRLKKILEDRNGRFLFCKSLEEAYTVCKRFRIKVVPYNYQLNYEKFVSKTLSGWFYRQKILRLLKNQNGHIRSSILRDLEKGEKTELRVLVDCMVNYAAKTKTPIPYIRALEEMLREIEDGKRPICEDAFYDEKLVRIEKERRKI